MTRTQRRLLAGFLTAIGVLALVEPASRLVLADEPSGPAIASVENAVALGILDPRVVDEVRSRGEAIGYVTLNVDAVAGALERRFPEPAQRAELLDNLRNAYAEAKRQLTRAVGDRATIVLDYDVLAAIALRFTSEEMLLAAARLPVVAAIRPGATGVADLSESIDLVGAPEVQGDGYRGQGTYVAVLDTGVDTSADPRWFPAGSVPLSHRATDPDEGDADGSATRRGHGTHVASTVLGVAPETRIVNVEVFRWDADMTDGPQWSTGRLWSGIRHVIALKEQYLKDPTQCCNIVAMNLSLGESGNYRLETCTDDFSLRTAYDVGIVPVLSAGNSALDRQTREFRPGIGYPACSAWALSVGASTDGTFARVPAADPDFNLCNPSTAVDQPTSFSQAGELLWMLAPGNCIVAAGGAKQGTSMAAPHVAGAVAALVSARPNAHIDDVWMALAESGPVVRDTRLTPPLERRRLDVAAALATLLDTTPAPVDPGVGTVRRIEIGRPEITVGTPLQPGAAFDLPVIPILNAGSQTETLRMAVAPASGVGSTPPGSWIVTTPSRLTLAPGIPALVQARIDLPADAPPGDYVALFGAQRMAGDTPAEDALAASLRLSFTVEEAGNPLGGLIEWISRTIGGSMLIRGGFGGLLLVGAYRVIRAKPPAPTTA